MKVLLVTGYKHFELGIYKESHPGITYIKKAIARRLEQLITDELEWILISGQVGVELWAAEVVYELQQEKFPYLKVAVLTPYENQEEGWAEATKEYYEIIVSQADFVDSITRRPYQNPSQLKIKNQFLVEKSDALLVVYDDDKEGTPKYMIETARNKQKLGNYDIHIINSYDIQSIVEEEQMENPDFWVN